MRKKNREELTPWAKYQKEHGNYSRKSRSQRKKRNFKISIPKNLGNKTWWTIAGLLMIAGAITFYFVSPISHIQKVDVSGNKRVEKTAILKDLNLNQQDYTITTLFNKNHFEKKVLKSNKNIKDINIKVNLNGNVAVFVKENASLGYVVRKKMYYQVREDGTFDKKSSSQVDGNLPVLRNFSNDKTLKEFLGEYSQIPNEVQDDVSEVDFAPTKHSSQRVRLYMNDGNQVLAIIPTIAKKMKYYPEISADMTKRGILNLEVGAYSTPYKDSNSSSEKNSSKKDVSESSSNDSSSSASSGSDSLSISSSSENTNQNVSDNDN